MNLKEMKEKLQRVLQIVDDNESLAQLSDLERDLVLEYLRDVYSALRFGYTKAEPAEMPVVEVAPATEPNEEIAPVEKSCDEQEESVEEPEVEVELIFAEGDDNTEGDKEADEVKPAEPIVESAEPTIEPTEQASNVEPVVEQESKPTVEHAPSHSVVDHEVEVLRTSRSAMYALYEETSHESILGESFVEKRAVADTIACPQGVAERTPISSLAGAIGVADKFLLIRELFDGDIEAYDNAVASLDMIGSFDDCMVYIAENYSWRPNSEGAKLMMELLQRKFNA